MTAARAPNPRGGRIRVLDADGEVIESHSFAGWLRRHREDLASAEVQALTAGHVVSPGWPWPKGVKIERCT